MIEGYRRIREWPWRRHRPDFVVRGHRDGPQDAYAGDRLGRGIGSTRRIGTPLHIRPRVPVGGRQTRLAPRHHYRVRFRNSRHERGEHGVFRRGRSGGCGLGELAGRVLRLGENRESPHRCDGGLGTLRCPDRARRAFSSTRSRSRARPTTRSARSGSGERSACRSAHPVGDTRGDGLAPHPASVAGDNVPARAGTSPAPTGLRQQPGRSVGDGLVPSRFRGRDNVPARAGTSPAPTGLRQQPGRSVGDGLVPSRFRGGDNVPARAGTSPAPTGSPPDAGAFRRGRACPVPFR